MYKEDTIAAVATPPGEGGVAIVRVSGPDAERIAKQIFVRNGRSNGPLRSRTLHHGVIRDPNKGAELDEVLLAIMRKPRSYTGEDVVEVYCHGGPFLVARVLELILSQGARHAEPGEFTRRAFLNGRLDLAQAEAVLDLIRARTEQGMKLALHQVRGELSKGVGELREDLLNILVQIEAAIDFPEEEIELLQREELMAKIETLKEKISGLIASYEWGRLFREGAKVCIVGRPNVGKSSLLNALLGEERVIVTPVPGTTRDVVEESVSLGGLPIVLWDTAGIRNTEDQVERIGVNFSLKHLKEADAALIVLDGSSQLTDEDRSVLRFTDSNRGLLLINKSDLPRLLDVEQLITEFPGKAVISISAKYGHGIADVRQALRENLVGNHLETPVVINNFRHKAALIRAEEGLRDSVHAIKCGLPPDIAVVDIQKSRDALEEIIGFIRNDDILERVFSNFCIGK